MARLPANAYEVYLELGTDRSYQMVADRFGVAKATVTNRAKKEEWQDRLMTLEAQSRKRAEDKAVDDLQAVHERQLKGVRFLQAKALEALGRLPPEKGIRAATALSIAWKHELLLLGEPTERQASVEEITKKELARWLIADDDD